MRSLESSSVEERSASSSEDSVSDAREAEDSFENSVVGKSFSPKKLGFKFSIKKSIPLGVIIGLVALFAVLMFFAQSAMPFAIVARMYEEFNSVGITSILRSDNVLDVQLSTNTDYFALTDYQKSSLEKEGILNAEFNGGTALFYQDNKKNWTAVVGKSQEGADSDVTSLLAGLLEGEEAPKFASPSVVTAEEALKDHNFYNKYNTASKTWRGGNAGWYDGSASLNESVRNLSRSRFANTNIRSLNFSVRNSGRVLGYTGKEIENKVVNRFTGRSISENIQEKMRGTQLGKLIDANSSINSAESLAQVGFKAATFLSGISLLSNVACQGIQLVAKAQTLITGYQNLQQMNYVTGFAESVQWVQAGVNNGEAMNEYAENLLAVDEESGLNAMQSEGMGALMSGATVDLKSKETQAVSSQGAISNMQATESGSVVYNAISGLMGFGTSMADTIASCTNLESGLTLLSTAVSVAAAAVTGGVSAVVELAAVAVVSSVISSAAQLVLEPILSNIAEWFWDSFGKVLTQNVATDVLGPLAGNTLVAGADRYLGSNHAIGGGSIATKESLLVYRREQEVVLAREAEYERETRSPFDTSSRHTFLGSIVYNILPIATSVGVGTALRNVSSTLTNSVEKLLPSASAIAETNLVSQIGDCENLKAIGAVGDFACVPFIITDTSTITPSLTPEELAEIVYNLGGIKSATPNSSGNYEIVDDSNFAKFINFCGQRTSDFGNADAGIVEALQSQRTSHWWNKIPLVGSIISAVQSLMDSKSDRNWITGYNCVARPEVSTCNNSDKSECFWQTEGRYYQAFAEYDRQAENMGITKKSSLALYIEDKLEKNPLDDSFEGVLARYSGMSKDDVELAIGFIYGIEHIANYDPSTRYAFVPKNEEKLDVLYEETDSEVILAQNLAPERIYIIYTPLRDRFYVI